ncbi:hypothetical protein [uncultured Duncaniella sp.]|nr:hypothetical protein [uncultured Duncaniella sp.]
MTANVHKNQRFPTPSAIKNTPDQPPRHETTTPKDVPQDILLLIAQYIGA